MKPHSKTPRLKRKSDPHPTPNITNWSPSDNTPAQLAAFAPEELMEKLRQNDTLRPHSSPQDQFSDSVDLFGDPLVDRQGTTPRTTLLPKLHIRNRNILPTLKSQAPETPRLVGRIVRTLPDMSLILKQLNNAPDTPVLKKQKHDFAERLIMSTPLQMGGVSSDEDAPPTQVLKSAPNTLAKKRR